MPAVTAPARPGRIALAAVLDLVCVVGFTAVGRASHAEDVLTGLLLTAWPFVVALALGWVALLAWRRPFAPLRTGVGVWVVTVVVGLLLRGLTGGGTALPFVIVTTLVLLVLLVGWRVIATFAARPRG
ncbi:DUF3054 family protein [Microbacterium sp. GXF7504]